MKTTERRIIIGISGASGTIYGVRALSLLRELDIETHLILTRSARVTLSQELEMKPSDVEGIASVSHSPSDIGASISSGSFRTMGMVVAPCSIKSLSEIASGITGSLLSRAADVTLKERRPLMLMVRETPLHLGHLRSMSQVSEIGATIIPPMPAFYAKPQSLDEMVDHSVGRMLDLLGLETGTVKRWEGQK